MHITTIKERGEYTATATRCGQFVACATCKRKSDAVTQARDTAQRALREAGLPAEPALTTEPLPGKRLAPEFSTGPLPFSQLVQNLRAVTRLG